MAIKDTLHKVLKSGIDSGYFEIKSIKNIDKTCCPISEKKVIDFDITKEKLTKKLGLNTISSCDAVKILLEDNRIDFIEMKSILNIQRNSKIQSPENLREQFQEFSFSKKIRDSLLIMSIVIEQTNMNLTGKEREEYYQIPKQPILLTDLDCKNNSLVCLTLTFDFLSHSQINIADMLDDELKKVGKNTSHNLLEAKLLDCERLKTYYNDNTHNI